LSKISCVQFSGRFDHEYARPDKANLIDSVKPADISPT
jgi:hypothetical protein